MEQQTLSTGLNLDIGINTQFLEEGTLSMRSFFTGCL